MSETRATAAYTDAVLFSDRLGINGASVDVLIQNKDLHTEAVYIDVALGDITVSVRGVYYDILVGPGPLNGARGWGNPV